MVTLNKDELWFNTPDTASLCRGGGNGPNHPSQLYAINKYVKRGMTLLDYGCGSGTTYEAMVNDQLGGPVLLKYRGLDIIPKNIEWLKKQYPEADWKVNEHLHKIDEPDQGWDVVYSRHVVDHMRSFEEAMDEHKRVAKKLVIVVLWAGMVEKDEHEIKNIVDHRGQPNEQLYKDEYTNNYSRKKVMDYLTSDPEWELLELTSDVGAEVSGHDDVIVLRRKE